MDPEFYFKAKNALEECGERCLDSNEIHNAKQVDRISFRREKYLA